MSANVSKALSRGPYRLEIRIPVTFDGPVHVGTGERLSIQTDAPVLRLPQGPPYLPGASIRGVLRDWCERERAALQVSGEAFNRLFGCTPDQRGSSDDRQGRLTVLDAYLQDAAEIRDHVSIKSEWGATQRGAKFDQEIVHAAGTALILLYEGDSSDDEEIVLLRSAVEALCQGVLAFGGKTGWGLGWVKVDGSPEYKAFDRSDTSDLASFLRRDQLQPLPAAPTGKPAPTPQTPSKGDPLRWSFLKLELTLQFEGPMLVAGPDRELISEEVRAALQIPESVKLRTPDHVYLKGAQQHPVLPGSSLCGTLRAHAFRIATTLNVEPIAKRLFGTTERAGLLRVGEGKHDGPLRNGKPACVWMDHVAIDRVTGFAAEGKLFNCWALASPRFTTQILVRWQAGDQQSFACVALLLFLLRDAEQNLLWAGSRTTRGYGYLRSLPLNAAMLSEGSAEPRAFTNLTSSSVASIATQIPGLLEAWTEACKRTGGAA